MVIIVMGVSGVGKTTLGRALAGELGWRFVDADDVHPAANVEKMAAGVALTDEDRAPWLERLRGLIAQALEQEESLVLACSALRRSYRQRLAVEPAQIRWVYLTAPAAVLAQRLSERTGHFMPPGLLESQLATLEPPDDALVVDVTPVSTVVMGLIRAGLKL